MTVVLILALLVVIFAVSTYNKFSYSIWSKRCYINSKHPDWTPYCGIDFIKKDPQWFIDNGYGDYIVL